MNLRFAQAQCDMLPVPAINSYLAQMLQSRFTGASSSPWLPVRLVTCGFGRLGSG